MYVAAYNCTGRFLPFLGAMAILSWTAESLAQPGLKECGFPEFGAADSVLDQELGPLFPVLPSDSAVFRLMGLDTIYKHGPYPTFELEIAVYRAVRRWGWSDPAPDTLLSLVEQSGPRVVARSLLSTVHRGVPYDASAEMRGRAAVAYGLLHSMYPDEVSALPLAPLLPLYYYPDDVRSGLAEATTHVREDVPEITEALSVAFCHARLHMRPLMTDESQNPLEYARNSTAWYESAVRFLNEVVRALAQRPGGLQLIEEELAREPNPILAAYVRKVAKAERWPP